MFQTAPEKKSQKTKSFSYHKEIIPLKSGAQLLAKPALQPILKKLKLLINQPEEQYQFLYHSALLRLAEWVQYLPSYKNKTYSNLGGLLDVSITRAYMVLSQYRQQFPVAKYNPDKMPTKLSLWSYALFTASLFYNIGYIATNLFVSTCDRHGRKSERWNPIQQSMLQMEGTHYRFSYLSTNYDALAARYSILFAKHLIAPEGLAWIASDIVVMDYWLAILQNDERGGGLFATQIMTAEEKLFLQDYELFQLLGIPDREKMLSLQEDDRLEKYLQQNNDQPEPDKEQPQSELPTDPKKGSSHMAVAISDRDVTGGQTYEIGERFIAWLKNGIKGSTISCNRPESMIHIVNHGELLATSQLYQEFCKQNPQLGVTWQQVANALKQTGAIMSHVNQFSSASTPAGSSGLLGQQQNAAQSGDRINSNYVFNQQSIPDTSTQIQSVPVSMPPPVPTASASATASPDAPTTPTSQSR